MTLVVENLAGGYGKESILHEISFKVDDGELVALVGLNGSGKSTTINHIIGLLSPKKGSITLNGATLQSDSAAYKAQITYVPEQPILYEELTLREHIDVTITAYQLDEELAWQRAERLVKIFRLDNKLNWFPVHFSKGMRQKVMLVMAFITDTPLLIIDEPFIGLDVLAVQDVLQLIAERKAAGGSILLTTHVLDTLAGLADRFVYLKAGKVAATGSTNDFARLVPELHQKGVEYENTIL
ncbi:ABC transporter ATP-binding protein [Weissella muntiaci]|uniref:ABC transporter ATP-binding protein n=1 Tax=Weissella muntiaci TaxID=2508881 RepID=A0A6C2C9T3_9LACO|nr:ABC transporter ATP-binding protein [Weissella muntiaci]TYC50704.1 ABC transporter ATP-binding protein [Weissella muntiaci]